MKTQEQLQAKKEELDKIMSGLMPTEKSNQELANKVRKVIEGNGEGHMEFLMQQTHDMSAVISTDAQRYLLEWILDDDK